MPAKRARTWTTHHGEICGLTIDEGFATWWAIRESNVTHQMQLRDFVEFGFDQAANWIDAAGAKEALTFGAYLLANEEQWPTD